MKWIKIEEGCEMPDDGDKCLILMPDLGKDDRVYNATYSFDEFCFYDAYQYYIGNSDNRYQPTHWARVELPEE